MTILPNPNEIRFKVFAYDQNDLQTFVDGLNREFKFLVRSTPKPNDEGDGVHAFVTIFLSEPRN